MKNEGGSPMERLRSECMTCVMRKYMKEIPEQATEKEKIEYLRKLFQIVANAPMDTSAPVIVEQITELQKEMFGIENAYGPVKVHFNDVMLGYEQEIKKRLQKAEEPLKRSIQYAMVGNYIDFGAMQQVDENYLNNLLDHAKDNAIDEQEYNALEKDLQCGKKLVFITDNCGEIVMDKLMIATIQRLYPQIEVTVLVRGGAVLNDATMEDARQIGLTEMVKVIGNGTSIAGTCLEQISSEASEEIQQADVVIAKGQGNFESLRKCGKNIYYIFLCKCEMFAREFKVPQYTGILVNDRSLFS